MVSRTPIPPYDMDAFERIDASSREREEVALQVGADALASERYLRLLDVLVDAAREPVVSPAAVGIVLQGPAARWYARTWDALAKRARKLAHDDPDDHWHEARIKAKQARYAAEAVTDVLGKAARRGWRAPPRRCRRCSASTRTPRSPRRRLNGLAKAHLDDGALCLVARTAGAGQSRAPSADSRRAFGPAWKLSAERRVI